MGKILTISIAAYNSEQFIKKTLDSLVIPEKMDLFEVFVIDDGGTDATLEIAKEYQKRYPATFIPVHKDNGGYGTTVNYSIEHASGKYFKLLDGDDWFDKQGFSKLLDLLQDDDSDAIVTYYYEGTDDDLQLVKPHNRKDNDILDLRNGMRNQKPFYMWELVYRTEIIRRSNLKLPSKLLYTDRYYCAIPFAFVNTIRFSDIPVYCYRIEREGQSMQKEAQIKHFNDRVDSSIDLCNFYEGEKSKNNPRCEYLLYRVAMYHVATARVVKYMAKNKKNQKKLMEYEGIIESISEDVVRMEPKCGKFGLFLYLCRITKFKTYQLFPETIIKKLSR